MPDKRSFFSEHTAEYYLIPELTRAFADRGVRIIPIYYWSTREGSLTGVESGLGCQVRVAAIYARRPKVETPGDARIELKFNASLFEAKRIANTLGLEVFAAAPLVNSLFGLAAGIPCGWFDLSSDIPSDLDAYCDVEISESAPSFFPDQYITPMWVGELADRIMDATESSDWSNWVDIISEFRRRTRTGHNLFGAVYKPFYVIIQSD